MSASPSPSPSRPGRLLLVASNYPPVRGGSAKVYDSLARHAEGRISILAPRDAYADGLPLIGWREHDRGAGYPIHRLPLLRTVLMGTRRRGLRRLRFLLADLRIRVRLLGTVLRLAHQEGCGAICVGELVTGAWLLVLLKRLTRRRVIVYVHGEEITTDDPYDPGRRRALTGVRAADGVVVVSRFTQRAVLDLIGPGAAGRVRLIENGVDGARFCPGPRRVDLVERYGLGGGFVFLSVCRLLEKKGVDHALDAFATLAADDPGLRFVIVGTGPYGPALQARAARLGIADRVVFTGQIAEEDLVDHYRLGDVFVMPNRALANGDTEGFGLVFLEANGCGLPVIAGRDGGSVDAVTDGVNGLVVDGNSVPAITRAMARLRADAGLRERLRQGGLACARGSDWTSKAEQLLSFALEGR